MDQFLPGNRLRGIPVNSAGENLTNREWSAAEPGDFSALQARVAQLRLDHAFTSTLRTDVTFRFLNSDRPERYHEPRGLNPDGRTMRREFRNQYRSNDDWSLTANGYQRWSSDRLGAHNVTFGFESVQQDWSGRYGTARERERGGPVPGIDLLAPVYGLTSEALYPIPSFTLQNILSRRQGAFVQDRIELLPRLQILLGGRLEHYSDRGAVPNPIDFSTVALTGRAGLVYRLHSRVSAFGSYGNAFSRAPALAQTPLANGPHEPEVSRQVEGGVKAELSRSRVLLTASLFNIEKRNVLRPDPALGPRGDNNSAVLPIGKVRNRGFEFDATGRVTNDLSVVVNYAFLDSVILEDRLTPGAVNKSLPNAARHAFGLFARYDIRKTGTALNVGNESRSRRFEPYANIQAAGYGVWDMAVFQHLHRSVELRVQLDNAFDKVYATSSLFVARAGNMPGTPRTFTIGLQFHSRAR
jgi:iron complex outermembrane receptor protein